MKTMTLPDREEMMARLLRVNNDPHLEERLYPILLEHALQEKNGVGVVMMLTLAIADYSQHMPPVIHQLVMIQLEDFVRALIDDESILADAKSVIPSSAT